MTQECQFCRVAEATTPDRVFCERCTPTNCDLCGSLLTFNEVERQWVCENDHFSDPRDVLDDLFEQRLNSFNKVQKIMFAGPRTEAIIPNSDDIIDVQESPERLNHSDDELVLYHGTRPENVDDILDEGLKTLTELNRDEELNESYEGSVRFNSVFGWPFTPEAGPTDYEFSEFVYFTVSFNDVVISSYSYLESVQFGHMSLEEYESEYCFDPEEYLDVCRGTGRPYSADDLLYFK